MSLPTNFFIGRGGGAAAFPTWTYSSPSTISGISKDSQTYTSAENATGTGLFFSEDGTKMYLTMYGQDSIYQYDLSTPWDQSSASYSNKTYSFLQQDNNSISSYIKPDGTTLYMTSYGNYSRDVWQYSMSTPWDISTLSYSNKVLQPTNAHDAAGIFMSRDGTRVYLGNYSDGIIRQHNLSTAWDISTASTSHNGEKNIGNLVSDTGGGWYEFWMSPDGTECYYFRSPVDYIYRTVLTTPWDITTATYAGSSQNRFNLGAYPVSGLPAYGVYVKPDGSKLYTYHQGNGQINRFSL
jgi:hypothetical protein